MKFMKTFMMLILASMFLFGNMRIASAETTFTFKAKMFMDVAPGASIWYQGDVLTKYNDGYAINDFGVMSHIEKGAQVGVITPVPGPSTLSSSSSSTSEGGNASAIGGDIVIDNSSGGGEANAAGGFASASNEGNDTTVETNIEIDNSVLNPVPLLPAPDFLSPEGTINGIWTSSKLEGTYTIPELCRIANPSKALLFLWYEWSKSFQIEMACHIKAKHTTSLRIIQNTDVLLSGFTKIGGAHARAVELHKSERQVVAALGVYATRQGATLMVVTSFSNPVTKGDSAVLGGGGGASTDPRYVINGAGGFGWTTSERVFRSFVVAELYRRN